ncbi:hypothetical protein NC652_040471 [Populus alba x Populus x berolinensis]|nr:hypothetical protein NC652_040471 [Populus alba x Populus x berolinensis]
MIQSLSRQVFQDPFVKLNFANTNNYDNWGGGVTTVYSCFLLGSVDSTRSLWPRLSTLNQSMTQEILHNICLLIPCSAPPISSLIT